MQTPTPGDQELVERCLARDTAAWGIFVDRFSRLIHWAIHHSLESEPPGGREEFSREVFQEFFERLLAKNELARLRRVKNIRRFLVVSACHLASDRLRSLSRHSRNTQPLEDWATPDDTGPAASAELPGAGSAELDAVLESALADLPARERACLDFHLVQGKGAQEVGRLLGIPEDTVRTVVRRAKDKLRNKLARKGFDKNI